MFNISGYLFASIAIAARDALVAPAFPIANVGKGIPAGICTIDKRLSIPFIDFDSIGTPSTGVVVSDAIIAKVQDGKFIVWKEYLDGRVKLLQATGELFEEEGEEPFPWPLKTEKYGKT